MSERQPDHGDLEREIQQTREHLAGSVDQLTTKAADGGKKTVQVAVPVAVAVVVLVVVLKRRRRP